MNTLKYKDEKDRAYGLGGMVIGMYVLEHENFIDSVSLDADADSGLKFTSDFFYHPNPNLSPKAVWQSSLEHFNLLNGLLLSNMLSRAIVRERKELSSELHRLMVDMLQDEGTAQCQLEKDEIESLYNKNFRYFHEIFSNSTVAATVADIAGELISRRKLDADDLYLCMRPLRRL